VKEQSKTVNGSVSIKLNLGGKKSDSQDADKSSEKKPVKGGSDKSGVSKIKQLFFITKQSDGYIRYFGFLLKYRRRHHQLVQENLVQRDLVNRRKIRQ
jgi:hypothetical protein